MKFSLDQIDGRLVIGGYGPGEVLVGRQRYTASLLVTPDGVRPDWGPAGLADLTPGHLGEVLAHRPELLILGTGERQQFPEPRLFVELMDAGVGYEVMDTAAACRTYNILLGEGRRVVAALLL
jgi:uncharacterized protein